MAQIECGRGHLYDPEKYPTCPYCKNNQQITVAAAGRTAPLHLSTPAPGTPEADVPAPVRSREAISTELDRVRAALAEARSSADRLDGQLHAAPDVAVAHNDCFNHK